MIYEPADRARYCRDMPHAAIVYDARLAIRQRRLFMRASEAERQSDDADGACCERRRDDYLRRDLRSLPHTMLSACTAMPRSYACR